MSILSAERLREVLRYDPASGDFRWLVASARNVPVGRIAGCVNSRGYRLITIDGVQYRAQRLAVLYMTGKFPDLDVDHEDTNPSNNRWVNLREATKSENCANTRRPSRNTSGYKGVYWHGSTRKWCALISVNRRRIYLGGFSSPEGAASAYAAAAQKHFGKFARVE